MKEHRKVLHLSEPQDIGLAVAGCGKILVACRRLMKLKDAWPAASATISLLNFNPCSKNISVVCMIQVLVPNHILIQHLAVQQLAMSIPSFSGQSTLTGFAMNAE